MNLTDLLFSEYKDLKATSQHLFHLLRAYFPEGCFKLVSIESGSLLSGDEPDLPSEFQSSMIERVKKSNSFIQDALPNGCPAYAIPVPIIKSIIIGVLSQHSLTREPDNHGLTSFRLCVELFSQKQSLLEEHNIAILQKEQISRKARALEQKFQGMLSELLLKRDEAEAANIIKREFLANMSHEMRTPLNAIIGIADLFKDTDLNDEQMDLIQIINNEATSLHNIINQILDFSKIEAGRMELEEIPFILRTLFEELASGVSIRAEQKGLELLCYIASDVPTQLIGDPSRLRQVLANIMNNAVKFTHEGELYARVDMGEDLGDKVRLRFSVKDTGIGIPEEEHEKIFDAFSQADGSTSRMYGGTGLGTTISKQIVELMGGEIGVESAEGKGSTFWFTLPFGKQPTHSEESHERNIALSGLLVLVVDDNVNNRFILKEYLKFFGCKSVEATNGQEALSILMSSSMLKEQINLIVTDVQMPEMDGFELINRIKAVDGLKDIPVLILTSMGRSGDGKICRDLGVQGYLNKPVRRDELHQAIVSIVGTNLNGNTKIHRTLVTKYTLKEQPRKQLSILVVEDYPTNQKVTMRYLKRGGYLVDLVENGKQAVSMYKRKRYDIILMDMQMPVMDGYEATARIRAFETEWAIRNSTAAIRVPIVATTAHAVKGDREKCLQAGADDYIAKPMDSEGLLAMVRKWTLSSAESSNAERDAGAQKVMKTISMSIVEPMNYEWALEKYEGDREFLNELLKDFMINAGKQIEIIRQAISDGNHEVVRQEAHAIKGGSGILTAAELSMAAFELEDIARSGELNGSTEALGNVERALYRLSEYVRTR